MKKVLLSLMAFLCLCSCGNKVVMRAQVLDIPFQPNEICKMVDELYNKMNMEERTAQLYSIRSNALVDKMVIFLSFSQ